MSRRSVTDHIGGRDMPTINSDTTLTLDGTTPVVVNGVQEYEWNGQ